MTPKELESAAITISAEIERIHFDILKEQLPIIELKYTESTSQDTFDFLMLVGTNENKSIWVGEIKVRNFPSTRFDSGILEFKKYKSLMETRESYKEMYNTDKVHILYLHFYQDGTAVSWRLDEKIDTSQLSRLFKPLYAPRTSYTNNQIQTQKLIYQIPYSIGKKYTYQPPTIDLIQLIEDKFTRCKPETKASILHIVENKLLR